MLKTIKQTIPLLLLCLITGNAWADETELLAKTGTLTTPKILFLMDNSSSMSDPVAGDALSRTRLQVLQDTFSDVIDGMDATVEVGIASYGGNHTRDKGVSFPVSPLNADATTILTSNLLHNDSSLTPIVAKDDPDYLGMFDLTQDNLPDPASSTETVKDYLKSLVSGWTAGGNTPIPGALYEATRYFKGITPSIGASLPTYPNSAHPSTYSGSVFQQRTTIRDIYWCPTEALCTARDTSISCDHFTTPVNFSETYISSCIADGTCSGICTLNPAAPAIPFVSTKVTCSDGSATSTCGTNCVDISLSASEPTYRCDSIAPATAVPTYTCSEYYTCSGPERDYWPPTSTATYNSPITDECDSNYLVLLSDGAPQDDPYYINNRKTNMQNHLSLTGCAAIPGATSTNTMADGECGPELTEHLSTTDLNTSIDGDQHVSTYTIGFGVADGSLTHQYLDLLAQKGGGQYFSGNNAAQLSQVFADLLKAIEDRGGSSLAQPGYSVDTSNILTNNNDVFIPVMKNIDGKPSWKGNLKKFKLSSGNIVDKDDNEAVLSDGLLKNSAHDLWSTEASTDSALSGGAAALLDPSSRKLFTDVIDTHHATPTPSVTLKSGELGTAFTEIKTSNSLITTTILNVPTSGYRNELLDFIRGYEIPDTGDKSCTDPNSSSVSDTGNCTTRQHMGDILNSSPVVVSYDDSDSTKSFVFVGTNEGFLHAFNTNDGEEKFAFMPRSLLSKQDVHYQNITGEPHAYGIDGKITVWRKDKNKDGKIKVADGDHVYLYFGLRRGGREYYALNVTDPANPKLLWKKDNTSGGAFTELGQSWSKPTLAKIRYEVNISGVMTPVEKLAMIVGAGYDPTLDEPSRLLRSKDSNGDEYHSMGRGIFIMDAETGDIIKSITHSDVNSIRLSIPGDIRVLDINKDGFMDRLYYSDTGGNIWRTDLFNNTSHPLRMDSVITRKFASLGEDVVGASLDSRKFFFEPDVAVFNHNGGKVIALTIGSGYHSNPLNTDISDRFYVLIDKNVYNAPATAPATITQANLLAHTAVTGSIAQDTNGKLGWYYDLSGTGEKILSSPLIFLNKVFFTSFTPGGSGSSSSNSCSATRDNDTHFYALTLLGGDAALDLDGDGTNDYSKALQQNQVLSTPSIFFRKGTCADAANCGQVIDFRLGLGAPVISTTTIGTAPTPGNVTSSIDIGSIIPKVYWLKK